MLGFQGKQLKPFFPWNPFGASSTELEESLNNSENEKNNGKGESGNCENAHKSKSAFATFGSGSSPENRNHLVNCIRDPLTNLSEHVKDQIKNHNILQE
jgi:hypothetical protein